MIWISPYILEREYRENPPAFVEVSKGELQEHISAMGKEPIGSGALCRGCGTLKGVPFSTKCGMCAARKA